MDSSSAQGSVGADLITDALSFYNEHFTKAYAAAISESGEMPEQVNNEIRNATTHLSRVSTHTDQDYIRGEAKKAKDHIERAIRDCYKIATAVVAEEAEKKVKHVFSLHAHLTKEINELRTEARNQYKMVIEKEAQDGLVCCRENYEKLYRMYSVLRQKIDNEYQNLSIIESRHQQEKKAELRSAWLISSITSFVAGVFVTLLSILLTTAMN